MPRFTIKRYEQILTQMVSKVVTRTRLSDLSNTSVWKHVLAAAARQDDEQYYQMTLLRLLFDLYQAKGDDLDERAKEIQPSVITRDQGNKSSGNVVFSRNGTVGTVNISDNQTVMTTDGVEVVTSGTATITPTSPPLVPGHVAGQDSAFTPAVAKEVGAAGNVEENTLVKFKTKPPGVDEVTNLSAFAFGSDKESDDSFLNRLIQYITTLARSTVAALEAAVLGVQDPDTGAKILFAKAIEDYDNRGYVTMYIDDGTGSASTTEPVTGENMCEGLSGPPADSAVGGESYLFLKNKPIDPTTLVLTSSVSGPMIQGTDYYVNWASGQVNFTIPLVTGEVITANYTRYTGLIELAQKIIDGDPNDRVNYPGYRAAGILVTVATPQVLIQVVEASIVVAEGYDTDTVLAAVRTAVKNYINTLGISGDVQRNEIIRIIKSTSGVNDLTLTLPSANVAILDDQMARTTDPNIALN